jgi:predicted dehydrogenase
MNPIRLGIVGAGVFANKKHLPALALLGDRLAIAAVTSRTAVKAEALADAIAAAGRPRPAVYTDHRRMLAEEKPDAVSLIVPPALNPELIRAALEAGCHVLAEKPPAVTPDAARQMLGWPERYGRTLMIAENYRYMSGYRMAARLIADGAIGRLQTAHWLVYANIPADSPYLQTDWRRNPMLPGGFLTDGGVHHAAVFRMLAGEVEEVTAFTASLRADLPPLDTMGAAFRFVSDVTGSYTVSYATAGPFTAIEIGGASGVVKAWRDRVEVWRPGGETEELRAPNPVDGLVAMYEDFAAAIAERRPPISTLEESLADLQVIAAMLRSAETGRAVRVAAI